MESGTWKVKTGLAQMLKGGVIMDVINAEQAKIAQEAGACAVMALERVPADIRAAGGVARMAALRWHPITFVNSSKIFPFSFFDTRRYHPSTASVYSHMLPRVMPPPFG